MKLTHDTLTNNVIDQTRSASVLQALIGEKITHLHSQGIWIVHNANSSQYQMTTPIEVGLSSYHYLRLYHLHAVSSLGKSIHKLYVEKHEAPTGPVEMQLPCSLTIECIELYGLDYEVSTAVEHEFNTTSRYPIEKDNPGRRIVQRIYDESTLVFYFSEGQQMIIHPQYPYVNVAIDTSDAISTWLQDENIRRKLEITEKGVIPYDRPFDDDA